MLADCELASNCSSISNECVRMYGRRFSKHLYDSPRLENIKTSMIAERKKPLLITHAKTIVNGRSQIEPNAIFQDKAFMKSRYEMRRKFFEDLEQKSSATDSIISSRKKITSTNKENELLFQRNSMMSPSEKPCAHVKLFNVSPTNASTKEHVENLNNETWSSNVAIHSVAWTNIAQPSFVKRVNMDETSSCIVSCINGDNQIEEEIGHHEMAECSTIASIKTPSTRGDKSIDSMVGTSNEQQHSLSTTMTMNTEVTLARSCAETFRRYDNNDNEEDSRPLSNLSSNIYDEHFIDNYECDEDNEASADKKINGELKPMELKKQNVRSWIESSMCESNWPNSAEIDSYESYYNDITKIVESIDVNIASSRTELDALPDTDTCIKYNLDSTNMSLIYSLTPPAAVDQDESGNDDTSRDLAEHSSEWQSDSTRSDNDEPLSDYIWMEPEASITKAECDKSMRDRRSSSDSSCAELEQSERHSASGSDILELPSCTIRELKDIDGEVFLNGINESANEIIADLNASDEVLMSNDAMEIVRQIIAEIIESIYVLLHLDSSIYDLSIVREIVRNLINSYHREYLLVESVSRARMSDIFTMSNDVDNICRIKGFLGNLSDYNDNQDYEMEMCETEVGESPAVIEFCTVAKKLPIVAIDNSALELNFRVVKVSTEEYANMSPNAHFRLIDENLIDNRDIEIKSGENVIKSKTCERCSYCRKEEEESMREKMSCLTPISEEPDDVLHETDFVAPALKNSDDELLQRSEVYDIIEENTTANSAKKHVSLDDTYTISEVSSTIVLDNDEMNDLEERYDSSIDCMSYSYETKEFMRLEKALTDSSQLNA